MSTEDILTLGQVAELIGAQHWRVRRLYERGILPEPKRLGITRVVTRKDVPAIKKAMEECGYLR